MILIVKSSVARIPRVFGIILCLSALLSACGQPGPLYLPKAPAKPATSKELAPVAPATTPPATQP
jgi:predicted small lipoprotein YifL